ncbi:MAG: macro domain-containing protein [Anaerovoracaceae bacterium]|jgi:O-acetyl-ADP-ribose deacetylase (regulator of RNase III)
MSLSILHGNIEQQEADAIITPAMPVPEIGYELESRIYDTAGREKLLRLRRITGDGEDGRIPPGKTGVTPAFSLHAKFLIHTVLPETGDSFEERLYDCYQTALRTAAELTCRSAAIPLLAEGLDLLPAKRELEIASRAIRDYQEDKLNLLTFALEQDVTIVVRGGEPEAMQAEKSEAGRDRE